MTTSNTLLTYDLGPGVEAHSTRRDSALPYPVIQTHQVHGFRVAVVSRPDIPQDALCGYDALVTGLPGCAIGVHTADCVPILIYNPVRRAVAAVHSGWKGTVQRIPQKVLFVMKQEFGSRPEELRAVIGPAIGPDSFQVGEEVVQFFKEQGFPLDDIWYFRPGRSGIPMADGHHIDLFGPTAGCWRRRACRHPRSRSAASTAIPIPLSSPRVAKARPAAAPSASSDSYSI